MIAGDASGRVRELVSLRRELHRHAELSDEEARTAEILRDFLARQGSPEIHSGFGGHGVVARYGATPGPNVLFRCDTDALPIAESGGMDHVSLTPGVSHKCGHDGHMTILCGLAGLLARTPPAVGSVTLLFQPAEETGAGALRVVRDARFPRIRPDFVFALHNLPGFSLGSVVLREGTFAVGSIGIVAEFRGVSSHAGEPEKGRSPARAVARTIQSFAESHLPREVGLVTVAHARLGEPTFGTSPGTGVVFITFRSAADEEVDRFCRAAERLVRQIAEECGVEVEVSRRDHFPATVCEPSVVEAVDACARRLGLPVHRPTAPFPWSEDFGHFTSRFPGALFGLGAGVDHPALHHPAYDFPDELLEPGARLLFEIAHRITSKRPVTAGTDGPDQGTAAP